MPSSLLLSALFICLYFCNGEEIFYDEMKDVSELYDYTEGVTFSSYSLCSDGMCARIAAEDPAQFVQIAVDTEGFTNIVLEFEFAVNDFSDPAEFTVIVQPKVSATSGYLIADWDDTVQQNTIFEKAYALDNYTAADNEEFGIVFRAYYEGNNPCLPAQRRNE